MQRPKLSEFDKNGRWKFCPLCQTSWELGYHECTECGANLVMIARSHSGAEYFK